MPGATPPLSPDESREFQRKFAAYLVGSTALTLFTLVLMDAVGGFRWFQSQPSMYILVPLVTAGLSLWRQRFFYEAFARKKAKEREDGQASTPPAET